MSNDRTYGKRPPDHDGAYPFMDVSGPCFVDRVTNFYPDLFFETVAAWMAEVGIPRVVSRIEVHEHTFQSMVRQFDAAHEQNHLRPPVVVQFYGVDVFVLKGDELDLGSGRYEVRVHHIDGRVRSLIVREF